MSKKITYINPVIETLQTNKSIKYFYITNNKLNDITRLLTFIKFNKKLNTIKKFINKMNLI